MTALAVYPAPPSQAAPLTERLTPDDLRELMHSVTEVTQRLQATHAALHDQVARLQAELADANAALRRSQALAALGEMAAGIAHEIRNPLGSIRLYARLLADDLVDRPQQALVCDRIEQAVMSLDTIVRDVLSFAREAKAQAQPTTSITLFRQALASCAGLLHSGMDVTLAGEPWFPMHVDHGLMVQALANVVRNAVEAMTEAGTPEPALRLWASRRRMRCPGGRSAARVVLCVQDNGPGIPGDVRERMFNPFFTTRSAGTGLGLAIVHRIVDAHGGHIVVENIQPRGARIELCVPQRIGTSAPATCAPARRQRAPADCSRSMSQATLRVAP
jgi:signal transduction histidine kinase